MATLKKLKLTQLGQQELAERQMAQVRGGQYCGCMCAGSSSTANNGSANYDHEIVPPGTPICGQLDDDMHPELDPYGGSHF